jgi:hypothetical protein
MSLRSCGICNSGREIAGAIEAAVSKKEKFRDIEKRCGFSKSLISKHMRQCVPEFRLARTKPIDFAKTRIIIEQNDTGDDATRFHTWPGGRFVPAAELSENDFIIEVCYEKGPDSEAVRQCQESAAAAEAALKPEETLLTEEPKTAS